MRYLGWIAVGGLAIGIVASTLATVVGAEDDHGFPWNRHGFPWNGRPFAWDRFLNEHGDCYDGKPLDATGPEHRWAWSGGDTVGIHVPGTVHYRGGDGDEVIVRGDPELVRRVQVHDNKIELVCGNTNGGDLDVTLPGRAFREVSIGGTARLTMENVHQPELSVSIGGAGSARLSGNVDRTSTSIGGTGKISLVDFVSKNLDMNIAGTGRIDGTGSSDVVSINIAGTGHAELADVPMQDINVTIAGVGGVTAAPRDKAEITIMGPGQVTLLTRPKSISTNIMGPGRVVQADKPAERGI